MDTSRSTRGDTDIDDHAAESMPIVREDYDMAVTALENSTSEAHNDSDYNSADDLPHDPIIPSYPPPPPPSRL